MSDPTTDGIPLVRFPPVYARLVKGNRVRGWVSVAGIVVVLLLHWGNAPAAAVSIATLVLAWLAARAFLDNDIARGALGE